MLRPERPGLLFFFLLRRHRRGSFRSRARRIGFHLGWLRIRFFALLLARFVCHFFRHFFRSGSLRRLRRLAQVLHDQRDSAVRRIKRLVLFSQPLIGKPPHLGDLIFTNTVALHQAPRRVGAIRRPLPIPLIPPCPVRLGVGVPFHRDGIG